MKQWLLFCNYTCYCQGWEETYGYFLVSADSLEQAIRILRTNVKDAENIVSHTLDENSNGEFLS